MGRTRISTGWSLLIFLIAVYPAAMFSRDAATPNFSGTWRLRSVHSKTAKAATAPEQLIIACTDQSIQVRTSTNPGSLTRTYVVDGKEHLQLSARIGSVTTSVYTRAMWDGSTLVIQIRSHLEDVNTSNIREPDIRGTERWSMSAGRHTLRQIFDIPGVSEETLIYFKQ